MVQAKNRSMGWIQLVRAEVVECSWHGANGERKAFTAEVVEVGPGRITMRTERGKVFTRPLPTAVVHRVLVRRPR